MKKKLALAVLLIIFSININAQKAELPFNNDEKFCYAGIIEIPLKNQSQLYKDAKEYVLLNYTNKDFPLILDEENDRIYVKGSFKVAFRKYIFPFFYKTKIYDLVYTMKMYFKDNRIKYEITDLFIQKKTSAKVTGLYWGYGISTGTIQESEVIKFDLEKLYIDRYRGKFYKLFQQTDKGIKAEIDKFTNYMMKENKMNDW